MESCDLALSFISFASLARSIAVAPPTFVYTLIHPPLDTTLCSTRAFASLSNVAPRARQCFSSLNPCPSFFSAPDVLCRSPNASAGAGAMSSPDTDTDDDDDASTLDERTAVKALRLFVKSALDESRSNSGPRGRYYELMDACTSALDARGGAAADATALLDALASHAAAFDVRAHESLVDKAFTSLNFWKVSREVREGALRLGACLVCAHGGAFSTAVVRKLVESFVPSHAFSSEDDETNGKVVDDVVRCLGNILRLVPLSERTLTRELRDGVPHKSAPKAVQVGYVRAALRLVEMDEGAGLRDDFLKALVAHLLEVDVEIKWDDVTAANEDESGDDRGAKREEEEDDAIFELDDIEKQIEEHLQAEWEQRPATAAPALAVDEAADTLDALMELALAHIDVRVDKGETPHVRRALMHAFSATLLPAPRSKFVQFLLFHLCSRDPESCRVLSEFLLEKLTDVREPASLRLAAAAYFASFTARAKFLTPEFICNLLRRLGDWCIAHVKQRTTPRSAALSGMAEKTKNGLPAAPNQTLAVFDSACQAMMYVLCYRAEDILRVEGAPAAALRSLPLLEILYSHLRPLYTCLPSVVTEFLHRAVSASMDGFTDVLLSEHLERIEKGEDIDISTLAPLSRQNSMEFTSMQVATNSRNRFPLRMFFPFDPYLLRRSAVLMRLDSTYVFWTVSSGERNTNESDEDEDEEGDEDDMNLSSSDDSDDDDGMETVSKSSMSDQARSFGVGSFNPRPRKLTRGLKQPTPLFPHRRDSRSPSHGNSGPSPSPGSRWPDSVSPRRDQPPVWGGAPSSLSGNGQKVPRVTAFDVTKGKIL